MKGSNEAKAKYRVCRAVLKSINEAKIYFSLGYTLPVAKA